RLATCPVTSSSVTNVDVPLPFRPCPPQTAAPPAEGAKAVCGARDHLLGHLAAALAERTHLAALGHWGQCLDQLGPAEGAGPPDDTGRHVSWVLQTSGQFAFAEIANPHSAIQPKVCRTPHTTHEANYLLLKEQLVHDLRAPSLPVRQLRLSDAPEMVP